MVGGFVSCRLGFERLLDIDAALQSCAQSAHLSNAQTCVFRLLSESPNFSVGLRSGSRERRERDGFA